MWTAYFDKDDDKAAGTAIAIWNEGQADEFRYSGRIEAAAGSRGAFVARAKTALAAEINRRTQQATVAANLTTALNG